jgi:redox-sensitive bicupin YhaK (pirin superfamily)
MHGFQLWANLPAAQKMMPPRYRGITADQIPEVKLEEGIKLKVIAGSIGEAKGPMDDIVIDPEYFDCTVPAGKTFFHQTNPDYTAFIYVIDGVGETCGEALENGTLALFDEGDQLAVSAAGEPLRFLMLTGKPLNEPVAWRGPIVMNTQAELELAFQEYREETFIKHK